jgi:hypothetical protein
MSYKINYFGWNTEQDGPTKHDKIWGYVTVGGEDDGAGGKLYNFWGKRGARLTFKQHGEAGKVASPYRWQSDRDSPGRRELTRLQEAKAKKGYRSIPLGDIEAVCGDGFIVSFEKQLTLAKLFNKFHGEAQDNDAWG